MIRISYPNDIYHSSNQVSRTVPAETKAAAPQQAAAAGASDKLQISSEGSFKSVLAELCRSEGRKIGDAVSTERLEALRSQLSSDSYQVSSELVADSLMSRISAYRMEDVHE